jgi:adenylate cyclase
MSARLERKLRLIAVVAVASAMGGVAFVVAQGFTSPSAIATGVAYGLLLGVTLAGISLFVLQGPMRPWLRSLSFTVDLMVRTAIYAAVIVPIQFFQLGDIIARAPPDPSHKVFWISIIYSVVFLILANLVLGIANIIGPRAFLNFVTGRYDSPVEENRFVLFVDIGDRPDWPSGSAGSPFTAFSIGPFVCLPSLSWIITVRSSTMSATR